MRTLYKLIAFMLLPVFLLGSNGVPVFNHVCKTHSFSGSSILIDIVNCEKHENVEENHHCCHSNTCSESGFDDVAFNKTKDCCTQNIKYISCIDETTISTEKKIFTFPLYFIKVKEIISFDDEYASFKRLQKSIQKLILPLFGKQLICFLHQYKIPLS